MFWRQVTLHRNYKHLPKLFTDYRYSHLFTRRYLQKYPPLKSINQNSLNNVRHASSTTGVSINVKLIAGLCTVGGAAIAYSVYRNKAPVTVEEDDVFIETTYAHEHLNEDLALISEYGPIPYLLIGGGCASFSAFKAIRARDPIAKILIITEEPYFPYMRPPLSKEMWFDDKADAKALTFQQWNGKPRSVFYENEPYFFSIKEMIETKNGGISVIRGEKVIKIDPANQTVYLDKGGKIVYKKCLIATGSKPKNHPLLENVDESLKKHITVFRTVKDYQKLDDICSKSKSIVIIGGGFLGSELACGLAKKGKESGLKVVQIFPETGALAKVLPEYLSTWTSNKITSEGVKIIPEVDIQSISKEGNEILLHLSNNDVLSANHVVVAVGCDANTELAKVSGLEVDANIGGFLVNTELEARKNLFVAGDAACFYDIKLGRRRVEHHDHAVVSGRLAGGNMAGNTKPYWHQSMFWTDLGPSVGFEAVGIIDSALSTVAVFTKSTSTDVPTGDNTKVASEQSESSTVKPTNDFDRGVIFYLRDDIIVGMLFWNLYGKMQLARQIINESKSSNDVTEIMKLFDIYSIE